MPKCLQNSLVRFLSAVACSAAAGGEPSYDGRKLSDWVQMMNATKPSHQATLALGKMGEPAIAPLIEAMRSHPSGAIRFLCHRALANIGPAALPALDKVMQDGDRGARIQAVLAFEKILHAQTK